MAVNCPLLASLDDKTCKEENCEFWIKYTLEGEEKAACVFKILAREALSRWAEEI